MKSNIGEAIQCHFYDVLLKQKQLISWRFTKVLMEIILGQLFAFKALREVYY